MATDRNGAYRRHVHHRDLAEEIRKRTAAARGSPIIPANIDYAAIVMELNAWGVGDYKIECICGFASGYVTHLKAGRYRDMTYQRAARLYNFWAEERIARGLNVLTHMGAGLFSPDNSQALLPTT